MNQKEKIDLFHRQVIPVIMDCCLKNNLVILKSGIPSSDWILTPRIGSITRKDDILFVGIEDRNGTKMNIPFDYLSFKYQNEAIIDAAYIMCQGRPVFTIPYILDLISRIEDNIIHEGDPALFANIVKDLSDTLKTKNGQSKMDKRRIEKN